MCNEAVDNDPHALEFVTKCFMTQKKCMIKHSILIFLHKYLFLNTLLFKKFVIRQLIFFLFVSIPHWYKTQKMCD